MFVPYRVVITLKDVLDRKKMSQRELSRRTGIRFPSVNNIATNKADRPPLDNFAKMCSILDCDLTDLIKLVPEKDYDRIVSRYKA